jgi:cold shock CspA family protein
MRRAAWVARHANHGERIINMAHGTIKTLVSERGFGFILPEQSEGAQSDLFFHRTDVQGTNFDALQIGQAVDYEPGKDERRGTTKATRVRVSSGA